MTCFSLRVMTYNIAGERVQLRRLGDVLQQRDLDLVLLQEVIRSEHVEWLSCHLGLPYWHLARPRRGCKSVALLSRWPLGEAHILHFQHSAKSKVALATPAALPAGSIWVCTTHLDHPPQRERGRSPWKLMAFLRREAFGENRRYLEARELRGWLQQLTSEPWIVGGDFNSLPLSRADRHLSQIFADALSAHPWRYLSGTFRPFGLPCPIRIDFIYYTPSLPLREARVLHSPVSDHSSILAVFAWPGRARMTQG